MSDTHPECRNDCIEELMFPKTIRNRPGLSRIRYRIGAYPDILDAVLRKLDADPLLASWTHREPDDPGIALLEGAAIVGDILTFYQEHYANEAYLRTAAWRESVADLVRLTGYILSPGVGGKTVFALEVKNKDKSNKPVTLPKGFPVRAQVSGLDSAADFETLKALDAYPSLSRFSLYRPSYHPDIKNGTSCFSVETAALTRMGLQLTKGDLLMMAASASGREYRGQLAVVEKTAQRFGRTEITIKGKWQGGFVGKEITAYKIGRSFRYLGYNGPDKQIVVKKGLAEEKVIPFSVQVGLGSGAYPAYAYGVYYPLPNLLSFPLDREVDDISEGTTVLVTLQLSSGPSGIGSEYFFERTVKSIHSATITRGGVSTGTTVIELNNYAALPSASPPLIYTDIRTVEFFEVIGGRFSLRAAIAPVQSADGSTLYYYGDSTSYKKLHNRPIAAVTGSRFEQVTGTVDSTYFSPGNQLQLRPLTLSTPFKTFTVSEFPLENPTVTVYGNLVNADQGKTEKETVLGNGDNREIFQSFKLPKAPLTYHNSAGETPPEVPELKIYVNDRLWKRVSTFFDKGPKEEIYIVREDEENNSWVQFGDGKTGARLPSGVGNVTAVYRTGTGAYGALKDETKPQPGGKAERLEKIHMPGLSSGGDKPETGDNAREAAPGKTMALGRLVSLRDFESEALAVPGVSKAAAQWEVSPRRSAVTLTLLMESGRSGEFSKVRGIINKYNICRGPQRFPVSVVQGKRAYIYIHAQFALDASFKEEKVEASIKTALGVVGEEGNGIDGRDGLFGLRARRFGQNAYASRIEAAMCNVEGVIWAKVTALESLGDAGTSDPSSLILSAAPGLSPKLACDDRHIFCLYKTHLVLSVSKDETTGRC